MPDQTDGEGESVSWSLGMEGMDVPDGTVQKDKSQDLNQSSRNGDWESVRLSFCRSFPRNFYGEVDQIHSKVPQT